ncbi:40S ribosomal protein S12 [Exserohilum turcicum]
MAALASSRQTAPPAQQLTPPSSSHGGRGSWDFAVPVNHLRESLDQEPYSAEYGAYSHTAHQPSISQSSGFAKPVRSPTWESQDLARSQLAPDRVTEVHKKKSGEMIATNTDQDSVLEYYKTHTNNKRGPASIHGKPKKKSAKAGQSDPEYDENNWIHRDKLKEIETRELEEAGFRVGRTSRSNSRSQSTSRRARDRTNSESTERTQNGDERLEPKKRISTIPAADEDAVDSAQAGSPVSQDDSADSQPASKGNHTVRPSTSRIPLPKTSGIPVPTAVAERDAPLPRSRADSTNVNGDTIATMGARVRSGSVGSQVLLDDYDGSDRTPPNGIHRRNTSAESSSPPKSPQKSPQKKPAGKTNTAASRKTSVQKTQSKTRTSGTSPPNKRPGTSGGMVTRPTTAHRPEGEAPWIASMYKPDPRLPPDQQIIPTHAKRMQQEQWENEGRVGSMYDKDFRLLNDDDLSNKRLSQLANLDPIAIEKAREEETWPLASPTKQDSSPLEKVDSNTPKSPTQEQSAYRLTPTIPQTADNAPAPKMAPPIAPAPSRSPVTRVPEPIEDAKEKKGCGCIVM